MVLLEYDLPCSREDLQALFKRTECVISALFPKSNGGEMIADLKDGAAAVSVNLPFLISASTFLELQMLTTFSRRHRTQSKSSLEDKIIVHSFMVLH